MERGGFEHVLRASADPDARQGLRGTIRGIAEMYATHCDVLRVLSSMALLDAASVGGAVQRLEDGRAHGMAELAQRLGDLGTLRPDVDVARATDVLCPLR